jgi:hypothetical protein
LKTNPGTLTPRRALFSIQLQQAIVMYYLCRDKTVRVLSASERYKFLVIIIKLPN